MMQSCKKRSPLNFSLQIFFVGVVGLLAACSDDNNSASEQNDQAGKAKTSLTQQPTQDFLDSNASVPVQPLRSGYKVVDSFNVGQNIYVRSMISDPVAKSLWVGTSVGVLEIDVTTRNMLNTFTRDHGLANEYVFGMLVDNEGKKWFGTNGGGITTYKDSKWKTYFPMHGLADYWVYSFAQQSTGTVWVGTWAGLNEFDPKTQKFKTYVKELVNEWVYGLDVDKKDQIWIGTEGGVNMFDGKTWQTWTHKDGLGAPNNENLPQSTNTGLGTRTRHDLSVMSQGMNTYNPNYVFSLIVAKDQSVWVGTWGGGVSYFNGTTWTNFTKKDGLAGNIVYSVAQDDNGDFWFGTNDGLSHYDGKTWETMTRAHGLLDNSIYAIASVGNNQVWVGSRNGVAVISK
jgi:ligand-binding sensor domain-containing protein